MIRGLVLMAIVCGTGAIGLLAAAITQLMLEAEPAIATVAAQDQSPPTITAPVPPSKRNGKRVKVYDVRPLPTRPSQPPRPYAKSSALTANETRLVNAINAYRARFSLPPLAVDPQLMATARDRAPYATEASSHKVNGLWPWEDARRHGFDGFATENLAWGCTSPEEAVGTPTSGGWGDSRPGHTVGHDLQMRGQFKSNGRFEDRHFDRVGVAIRGTTYVAFFGKLD